MISNTVKHIIGKRLSINPSEILEEQTFVEDLDVDDLDMRAIIKGIEQRLAIRLPDEASLNLHTVRDVIIYIQNQREVV